MRGRYQNVKRRSNFSLLAFCSPTLRIRSSAFDGYLVTTCEIVFVLPLSFHLECACFFFDGHRCAGSGPPQSRKPIPFCAGIRKFFLIGRSRAPPIVAPWQDSRLPACLLQWSRVFVFFSSTHLLFSPPPGFLSRSAKRDRPGRSLPCYRPFFRRLADSRRRPFVFSSLHLISPTVFAPSFYEDGVALGRLFVSQVSGDFFNYT